MANDSIAGCQTNITVYVALLHYPVLNKSGETIASAVTPIDLHDIARAARTYGVGRFYVVTPLEDQQKLVQEVIDYWIKGYGATYNPKRGEALETIRIVSNLDAVIQQIRSCDRSLPKIVATSSRHHRQTISFEALRQRLKDGMAHLLLFGTAWGLAPTIFQRADYCLQPIKGCSNYNHLSVRSAATAVLDRLMGC